MTKKIMLYDELRAKQQDETNNLPMYFAFSDSQLNDVMTKTGYTDKEEFLKNVFTIGAGSIILKKDKKIIFDTFKRHDKEMKNAFKNDEFLQSAFEFELANHEYIITYELDDTLNSLGISEEQFNNNERYKKIMKKAIIKYEKEMEKFGY